MALNENIPLAVENANPLGAIYEARGVKARGLANQAQAQNIDKQAQEMEKRSLIDGAVQLNEYLKDENPDAVGATRFLENRIKAIEARGGNSQQSKDVLTRLKNGEIDAVKNDVQGILALDRTAQNNPAALQEFNAKMAAAGLKPGDADYLKAARINLGLDKKEVGASDKIQMIGGVPYRYSPNRDEMVRVKVNGKELTAEDVAESEATIAESKKFAELTGKGRAEAIETAVEEIGKLEMNISNLDEAYQALEEGAESGPLVNKWTPTLREETQRLQNVKNRLGLDVVGAVTFGALSQGELDIALATALPDLPPEELKAWIRTRQEAQRKLVDYFDEQIDHLSSGGTIASFRQKKRAEKRQGGQNTQGQGTQNNQQYKIGEVINVNGQQFRVIGGDPNDPEVEPLQ